MMTFKRLIAAAAFAVIAAGPAAAADIAARPLYKAPPPLPAFTWSGLFIGGHGAYAWGNTKWSENELGTGGGPPGFQDASFTERDWLIGGQAGFNYQLTASPIVWGIWADDSAGKLKSSASSCFPEIAGTVQSCSSTVHNIGTLVGRVGFAFDRTMIYALGGWAWGAGVDQANSCAGAACAVGAGIAGTNFQSIFGYTVGGGIEYAFAGNWSVFAQYNYIDFGTWGENFANPATSLTFTENIRQNISVVKFGINFRFGQPTVTLP
jgi:outer membrane immunogenic protein